MASRLQQKFEVEVERYVSMLFENCVGADAFEACLREQSAPIPYIRKLLEVMDAAERARDWFSRHGPSHLQPLPLVHCDEQEKILCSGDMDRHLVVHYSNSLQHSKYNYLEHPLFFDYARGVVALPDEIQASYGLSSDELLAEFPPKPLLGLDGFIWHPPTAGSRHPAF